MELLKLLQKATEFEEKSSTLKTRNKKLKEEMLALSKDFDLLNDFESKVTLLGILNSISQLFGEFGEILDEISNLVHEIKTAEDMDELFEKIDIQFAKADELFLKMQILIEIGKRLIPPETKPEDEGE